MGMFLRRVNCFCHVPNRGLFLLSMRSFDMKKKKQLANGIMVAVIVLIVAVGVLLTGRHLGWFDRNENIQDFASVLRDKGVVDLTRDGIAAHLDDVTVLRDGDQLSANSGAQATVTIGESYLILGEKASARIDHAAVDGFSVTVLSGDVFLYVKNAVDLAFGEQSCVVNESTLTVSVQTGSETVSVLSGEVTLGGKTVSAGQTIAFAAGSDASCTTLKADSLNDFFIHCAQDSAVPLCFTADELSKVLDDRKAQKADTTGENPDGKTDAGKTDADERGEGDNSSDTDNTSDSSDNSTSSGDKISSGSSTASGNSTASSSSTVSSGNTSTGGNTPSGSGDSNSSSSNNSKEQEDVPVSLTCTIQIRCDTILDNMDNLESGKDAYVPSSGTILSATTVSFTEGETVFDVLKRVCNQYGIQLEYSYTPVYESYYIEGINYLYEFDCGNESGWMYKVNGWFPNYGCSDYTLEQGDNIVWCYTCNGLGADVGGGVG